MSTDIPPGTPGRCAVPYFRIFARASLAGTYDSIRLEAAYSVTTYDNECLVGLVARAEVFTSSKRSVGFLVDQWKCAGPFLLSVTAPLDGLAQRRSAAVRRHRLDGLDVHITKVSPSNASQFGSYELICPGARIHPNGSSAAVSGGSSIVSYARWGR